MFTVREATQADLPAICRLGEEVNSIHHAAFPNVFAGPGAPDRDAAHWSNSIGKPDATTLVAEEGGAVVAFVTLAVVTETNSLLQPARVGRVGSIGVTASRRNQGLGKEIMRQAHTWLLSNGAGEVRLNVWTFNSGALQLCRELGYEVRSMQLARSLSE